MGEYIEREATIKAIHDVYEYRFPTASGAFDDFATKIVPSLLNSIPAADVVPVARAKWIHTKTEEDDWGHSFHHWHCSACGWFEGSNPEGARKYCSGCGAKMEGVVDNA